MSTVAVAARPSQVLRQRRESQRPSLPRASTAKANNMENGVAKEESKRYVYTQQDILAKFKGCPPSLRVHLHQNHFRLNDSQESLSYASPMKELLQHIRNKTVPHNMVDEFYRIGTPFYDNCLIVEVHDFRSAGIKPKDDSNSSVDGSGITPFSIHNHNAYITPSPHVPYPTKTPEDAAKGAPAADAVKEDKSADKENMPAPGQPASQKQTSKGKVITVVLFPTALSHQTDIQLLATTAAPDMQTYRRNQAAGRGAGNPPTPLTTVPPTPTLPTGRSPKRQKMVIDETNVHEFEAAYYNATCPKLYLEPTRSLGESVALIDAMTHPNNNNPPPTRKSRKRTTAELAADQAEAADIQRFMLAGDEFQASKTAAATNGDDSQPAVRGGANFQTFSRFKTLESIKLHHEETERRKKEEEARQAQLKRAQQAEAEAQKRRDMESAQQNEAARVMAARQQEQLLRQQAAQQQHNLQQEQAMRAAQTQAMANAGNSQISATPQSASQPVSFQSPVVRQNTPMASSPMVTTHPVGGTPMMVTSSNHGAGSPARPPSVVSHHPMARSISQQQTPMSRTGTPQIIQGTPQMGSVMPARNMASTPQPRMNQGSPTMPLQGGTPMMMQTPQPQQGMTPEMMQHRARMQAQAQAQIQMRNMQMSPGQQMTPQQAAMLKAKNHIMREGVPQGQNANTYHQLLAQRFLAEMQQQQQQQQQLANMSPHNGQVGVPNQGANNMANMSNMTAQQLQMQYTQRRSQLIATFGTPQAIPAPQMQQMHNLEAAIKHRRQQEMQAAAGQMQMNQGMQGQMNMNGQNVQNNQQMQQYQLALQQQRAQQARLAQMQRMSQQQGMQGGQMPQNMQQQMNAMNMQQQMNQMNMGNMGGINMQQQMSQMGQMNMGNMGGMQGMQGMGNVQQMNQMQQAQMIRLMQARAQLQQNQGGGNGGMEWSG